MNESTRSLTLRNSFENPGVTIAAGLTGLGIVVYTVETYLASSLFLDGGNPATFAGVLVTTGLLYLAVFAFLR